MNGDAHVATRRRERWGGLFAITVLVLAGASSAAEANSVRGALEVSGLDEKHTKEPESYWHEWNGAVPPRNRAPNVGRQVSVVLTGAGEPTSKTASFRFHGGGLAPETIVVRVGTKISIENTDIFDHVLSAQGLKELPPLATSPAQTRAFTISETGHWKLTDSVQPHMRGYLHCLSDLVARAEVDERGHFVLSDVPPGTYALKVFFRDKEIASQPIEVAGSRDANVGSIAVKIQAAE